MSLPQHILNAIDTIDFYISTKHTPPEDDRTDGLWEEWNELDFWMEYFHRKTVVYAHVNTVRDGYESTAEVMDASQTLQDEHEVQPKCDGKIERSSTPCEELILTQEGRIENLISKTLDQEAKRIQEIAINKEKMLEFMNEMHVLSLQQDEERHKRTIQQDKERLLLYREHGSTMLEFLKSPKVSKNPDIFENLASNEDAPHMSLQSNSRDRKKRNEHCDSQNIPLYRQSSTAHRKDRCLEDQKEGLTPGTSSKTTTESRRKKRASAKANIPHNDLPGAKRLKQA